MSSNSLGSVAILYTSGLYRLTELLPLYCSYFDDLRQHTSRYPGDKPQSGCLRCTKGPRSTRPWHPKITPFPMSLQQTCTWYHYLHLFRVIGRPYELGTPAAGRAEIDTAAPRGKLRRTRSTA